MLQLSSDFLKIGSKSGIDKINDHFSPYFKEISVERGIDNSSKYDKDDD